MKIGLKNCINLNVSFYFVICYLLDWLVVFCDIMFDVDLWLIIMVEFFDFVLDEVDVVV